MPFKRPVPPRHESSSSTILPSPKRSKIASSNSSALKNIKIHIVDAKLNDSVIGELYSLSENAGGELCTDVRHADVIITTIGMRRRLERHLGWEIAKEKAIVTPDWIRESVRKGESLPCGDYAALEDLHDETVKNCPDHDHDTSNESDGPRRSSSPRGESHEGDGYLPSPPSSPSSSRITSPLSKLSVRHYTSKQLSTSSTHSDIPARHTPNIPAYLLPPDPPIPTDVSKLDFKSRYACCRASPLICQNQGLVEELNIIRNSREVEGEARSALSYERAISVLKAYPYRVTSRRQVEELSHFGEKISGLVEEYLNTGHISEAQTTLSSPRYTSLTTFASVYGIGPNTARSLYSRGLRTIRDLEVWYGIRPPEGEEDDEGVYGGEGGFEKGGGIVEIKETKRRYGKGRNEEDADESWIKIALGLREELDIKIPRDEVEEIGQVVGRELEEIQPGCVYTIVGGYRRGKPMSNDVDIVFTHPDVEKVKGLCGRFISRLYERGLVSHVMHLSGFHDHNALRTTHWDSLEKALTVFMLPSDSPFAVDFPDGKGGHTKRRGTKRRLDLIFATPEVYWTAVIGWTGSIMFQRDLRQWAKAKKGYKFDSSGITRRRDSKQLFPKTEKDVFDLFELEWIDPVWRNADA